MLSEAVFARAGVRVSPEEFEQMVLSALDAVAPGRVSDPVRDLPAGFVAALRRGGAPAGEASPESLGPDGPAARGAALYTALLATSLTVPETARRLGVDESRIRQRIRSRSLYALKPGGSWRLPIFQFQGDALVPGISRVLPHLDPRLAPLTVVGWFRRPSPNLATPEGEAHTPLDWLAAGRPVAPVVEAAAALGRDG